MSNEDLLEQASALLLEKKFKISTAESCTGGLLSASLTHRPGASQYFDCGFITYSNKAKTYHLHVPEQMIAMNGAVSEQVAISMARGALKNSSADIALSITGVAGPDSDSKAKPVGLVYIGFALKDKDADAKKYEFSGNREEIRRESAQAALKILINLLQEEL